MWLDGSHGWVPCMGPTVSIERSALVGRPPSGCHHVRHVPRAGCWRTVGRGGRGGQGGWVAYFPCRRKFLAHSNTWDFPWNLSLHRHRHRAISRHGARVEGGHVGVRNWQRLLSHGLRARSSPVIPILHQSFSYSMGKSRIRGGVASVLAPGNRSRRRRRSSLASGPTRSAGPLPRTVLAHCLGSLHRQHLPHGWRATCTRLSPPHTSSLVSLTPCPFRRPL